MLQQLQQLGAPPEVIAATAQRLQAEADGITFAVWPDNWHAVLTFVAMATQWHWVGTMASAQRTGLRLEALPAVLPAMRRTVPRRWRQPYHILLQQLQHLEDTALAAWRLQQ